MDLIKITYGWKASEGRYVPGPPEKIPGEKVEQKQLERLYTSTASDSFEEFLAGSWVQIQPDATGGGRDRYLSIINFDPRARKISLSSGDTEEVYIWKDSLRTIYNRLFAIGENETVRQISKTFSLTVETASTLSLSVQGSDPGETPARRYTKVSEEIEARLLERQSASSSMSSRVLQGVFAASGGQVVDFENPRLTWTEAGRERSGIYALYTLGGNEILQVRYRDAKGAGTDSAAWLVGFKERQDRVRSIRILSLTPVVLTVNGYEESGGNTISFEQVTELKKK